MHSTRILGYEQTVGYEQVVSLPLKGIDGMPIRGKTVVSISTLDTKEKVKLWNQK